MKFGLQTGGPFHGLPCVKWVGAEEAPSSFSQLEFKARLDKAAETLGLAGPKKFLMFDGLDCQFKFDELVPLIRTARGDGWFCVLETPSTQLSAAASEFNAVVARHESPQPEWLMFPCAGIVLADGAAEPRFDGKTAGIPKFVMNRGTEETLRFLRASPHQWCVQERLALPVMEGL